MPLFLGAIWRWFKVNVLRVEGAIDEQTDKLMEDPHVMDAVYRKAILGDMDAIQRLKAATAGLVAAVEQKRGEHARLEKELEDMYEELEGAKGVGAERAQELRAQGKTTEEIMVDPEFVEAQEFFEDIKATIAEREERVALLEERIDEIDEEVTNRERQLRDLHRQLGRLKTERHEAKADAVYDRQIEAVADALAGIDVSSHRRDLEVAREARAKLKEHPLVQVEPIELVLA